MTAALAITDSMPDLLGTSPADLLPHGDRHDSTPDEARARADRLRAGIVSYAQMRQDIADAYAGRDWIALGYGSWYSYVEGEFGEQLAQLGRGERREAVADLRGQGMSTRQIANATGIGQSQVRRDLAEVSPNGSPATVTGSDGKQHPASRPAKPKTPEPTAAPTAPVVGSGSTEATPASTTPQADPRADGESPTGIAAGGAGAGHLRLVPPPGSPATWTPEQHAANDREIERKRAVEAAERFAKSLVMEIRGMVTVIIDGLDNGAPGILVSLADIDECRAALDQLEERVMA